MNAQESKKIDRAIRKLSHPKAYVRREAAGALRYSSPKAIPALMQALADADADVRLQVVLALGSLDAVEAIDAMVERLRRDPDESVRYYACGALAEIRAERKSGAQASDEIVMHLVDAYLNEDETEYVRGSILHALGETDNPLAVPTLCDALSEASPDLRENAMWGFSVLLMLGGVESVQALEALCLALKDTNPKVVEKAAEILGYARYIGASPHLLDALNSPAAEHERARKEILGAICCIDMTGNLPLLMNHLRSDPERDVQREIANNLSFPDFASVPQELLQMLADPARDRFVKSHLAKMLASTQDKRALPFLLNALGDLDEMVRSEVCAALCWLPDRKSIRPLMARLGDDDSSVRQEAALALASIANEACTSRFQAFLNLVALFKAVDAIAELLAREELPSVRRRLVWALSFFTCADVEPLLTKSLRDEDPHVRSAALTALAETVDEAVVRQIVQGIPGLAEDLDEELDEILESMEEDGFDGSNRIIRLGTLHYE